MKTPIPFIPEEDASKYPLDLPIDTNNIIKYLRGVQNPKSFYNSIEETFWATMALKKLGKFPDADKKPLIEYVLKHRMDSGGYTNKLTGDRADIWTTFFALALLELIGVFRNEFEDVPIFCPDCGQKQLYKSETCFNCGKNLLEEEKKCMICGKVIQTSSQNAKTWTNLCNTCHDLITSDLTFILRAQTKKGFMHCFENKCDICSGKPSYKSTFFALNALKIINGLDRLDQKSTLTFLHKNQYINNQEHVFQVLSYFILDSKAVPDYTVLLQNIKAFQQKNNGFAMTKKIPTISDTFWGVVPFKILHQMNLIQLGPIPTFLLGLKRVDGGYSEQIMDPLSSIHSTVQAYLITLMIFDPLIEMIEEAILHACQNTNRIYLAPIAAKCNVPLDFVESVAYYLFTKDWFIGKILDQFEFFKEYLQKSNVMTQKIGISLLKAIQNQSELDLYEFCKNAKFDFENAEERVKTVIIDFLVKKLLEGEIQKVKKHYLFKNINLPRKFIWLTTDEPLPVEDIFAEKMQVKPTQELIRTKYEEILTYPKQLEAEICELLSQDQPKDARNTLKEGVIKFQSMLDEFQANLSKLLTQFKFINFADTITEFLDALPLNKKTLLLYMEKLKEKLDRLIKDKESSLAHDALISKEQRIIQNFEEYLQQFIDKVELVGQIFKNQFQEYYKDEAVVKAKLEELNTNIDAYTSDLAAKSSQITASLEISEKPETINDLSAVLNTKIELITAYSKEASKIITLRTQIPAEIDEFITKFKDELIWAQATILEKIDNKEFDSASKELEAQDTKLENFKPEIRQKLEELIKKNREDLNYFSISFDEFRVLLNEKLQDLENEWNTHREELLSKFLEKTELSKQNELKKKLKEFYATETETFNGLKTEIENLIRHENIFEAKEKLNDAYIEFHQHTAAFETEINNFIKVSSKQFKTFKKKVTPKLLTWKKDIKFIQDSMDTLQNSLNNLSIEKELLSEKNKLGLIIKNQKLLLSKALSNLLQMYRKSIQKSDLLNEENDIKSLINDIRQTLRKGNSRITTFVKDNSKKLDNFLRVTKDQVELWQKESNLLENTLQKIQDNIVENLLIGQIYFIIKAFQGYKAELKYLAKAINMKFSQLKDKLVYLLSNSKLDGTLDPIHDLLILNTLKPVSEETESFLKEIETQIGSILQIDFATAMEIPKDIGEKKEDLLKLRYLLIIHRQVGATLYHRQFGTWEIDPDLISGFLTAIQSFGQEIKSKDVPIQSMGYKEFEITLNQGKFVHVALIIDGKSSDWHKEKLAEFTKEFERQFQENLQTWSGELTQFKSAGLMIDRVFELYRVFT
ncbi:MAG: prenyltransferase/squalene oxidase repeat-containing protein [Candidatus Helarchaeota archaeon]